MNKFEGLPKLKKNLRKLSPLIGALALGLLAAVLGWYYLKSSEREIAANLEKSADSRRKNVVVAAQALPGGTVVTSDMVALRSVPIEFVHGDALTPDTFNDFSGQQLVVGVDAGKPLLAAFFAEKRKVFSEQIEAGVRAITIPVDEISSISGLLRAGDRVDFMYVVEQQGEGSGPLIVPLLQDVEVRATGKITADEFTARRNRPTVAIGDDPYAQQTYSTVTVAIQPKDAQKLILAQRMGKIIAALRNPVDRETLQSGTDAADLTATVNSFRPIRPVSVVLTSGIGIEYIVGGVSNSGTMGGAAADGSQQAYPGAAAPPTAPLQQAPRSPLGPR